MKTTLKLLTLSMLASYGVCQANIISDNVMSDTNSTSIVQSSSNSTLTVTQAQNSTVSVDSPVIDTTNSTVIQSSLLNSNSATIVESSNTTSSDSGVVSIDVNSTQTTSEQSSTTTAGASAPTLLIADNPVNVTLTATTTDSTTTTTTTTTIDSTNSTTAAATTTTTTPTTTTVVTPTPTTTNVVDSPHPPLTSTVAVTTSTAVNQVYPSYIGNVAQGTYNAKLLNSQLPAFSVTFSDKYITVNGCNTINIPIQIEKTGRYKVNGPIMSTLKYCQGDIDLKYIQLFKQADTFTVENNNVYLTSKSHKLVQFQHQTQLATTKHTTTNTISSVQLTGKYILKVAGSKNTVQAVVDKKQIQLFGCNNINAAYSAGSNGEFKLSDLVQLTKRYCAVNHDNEFITALRSADKFAKNNNIIELSRGGKIVATLQLDHPVQPPKLPIQQPTKLPTVQPPKLPIVDPIVQPIVYSLFSKVAQGNYNLKVINSNLPAVAAFIGDKNIQFQGCNRITIPAIAQPNGLFRLSTSSYTSTLKKCIDKTDEKYVQAIKSSNGYVVEGNNFFLTSNGKKLVQFDHIEDKKVAQTNKPVVQPKPATPVVVAPVAISLKGDFNLHYLGFESSVFTCNVDDKVITFQGCNKVAIHYDAHTDDYFKITQAELLTKNTCHINIDNQLINAFKNVEKFERDNNGVYFTKGGKHILQFIIPHPVVVQPKPNTPVVPVNQPKLPFSGFSSLKGIYNGKISGSNGSAFSFNIDDKQITFQGCNKFSIPYDAHLDGFFKASLTESLTKNTCHSNNDNELIAAIKNADKFERDANGIYFSKAGKRIFECSTPQKVQPKPAAQTPTKLGLIGSLLFPHYGH